MLRRVPCRLNKYRARATADGERRFQRVAEALLRHAGSEPVDHDRDVAGCDILDQRVERLVGEVDGS